MRSWLTCTYSVCCVCIAKFRPFQDRYKFKAHKLPSRNFPNLMSFSLQYNNNNHNNNSFSRATFGFGFGFVIISTQNAWWYFIVCTQHYYIDIAWVIGRFVVGYAWIQKMLECVCCIQVWAYKMLQSRTVSCDCDTIFLISLLSFFLFLLLNQFVFLFCLFVSIMERTRAHTHSCARTLMRWRNHFM